MNNPIRLDISVFLLAGQERGMVKLGRDCGATNAYIDVEATIHDPKSVLSYYEHMLALGK